MLMIFAAIILSIAPAEAQELRGPIFNPMDIPPPNNVLLSFHREIKEAPIPRKWTRRRTVSAIKEAGDVTGAVNNVIQFWWLIRNWTIK